jgi:hypothetical protein
MHLGGAPGHCVSRAGLVATTLLSAGIPARVLQVVQPDVGHNIIEVWDAEHNWVMFDPNLGMVLRPTSPGPYLSAADVLSGEHGFSLVQVGDASPGADELIGFYKPDYFRSTFIYPEPWLYTRTAPKASFWPFGGRFTRAGGSSWQFGGAQFLLRFGVLACGIVLLAMVVADGLRVAAWIVKQGRALASSLPAGLAASGTTAELAPLRVVDTSVAVASPDA